MDPAVLGLGLGGLSLFLLMVPESACVPVPSEPLLLAAGLAVHQGRLGLATALLAATAGNVVGSLLAWWAGRRGALIGLARGPRRERALRRCEGLFDRYGDRAVLIGRLIPLARTFVSLPAGHASVPLGRFLVLTTMGCAIWAGAFVGAGAALGEAAAGLGRAAGPVGAALALAAGAVVLLRLRRRDANAS